MEMKRNWGNAFPFFPPFFSPPREIYSNDLFSLSPLLGHLGVAPFFFVAPGRFHMVGPPSSILLETSLQWIFPPPPPSVGCREGLSSFSPPTRSGSVDSIFSGFSSFFFPFPVERRQTVYGSRLPFLRRDLRVSYGASPLSSKPGEGKMVILGGFSVPFSFSRPS